MTAPSTVVVVGAGIAGVSAAASMRASGYDGRLLLVGDETHLPYRRTAVSKEILRGDKDADGIRIKPEQWYADQQVELVTGTAVVGLEPDAVVTDAGERIRYDKVVLATGGRARKPYVGERICTIRGLSCLPLPVGPEEPVVIVGAGLIGSEGAASLRSLGYDVTLLETADLPLPRLLPGSLAERYVALHKSNGVDLQTGVSVTAVEEHGDEVRVTAADGRSWTAGMVLVAVGMEPNTELAAGAGLRMVGGGIEVDWSGQTSAPGVYAAGDVAARPSSHVDGALRLEHWQGAQNHGTAVGKAVAGETVEFDEVPWCWSDQYGQSLQVTGWTDGEVVVRGDVDSTDFSAFFVRDGVLRGAVALGRPSDVRAARTLVAARAAVDTGMLADAAVPVAETLSS
ncbi:MAG TPA: FAD-dependent oxidoreductase [Nocardioidaceae bacterium]|nr:FAD-dependent oxidoreductase [Nocardioidaceae bacterium]